MFARTHRREGRRASVIRVISTALFLLRQRIGVREMAEGDEPPRLQLSCPAQVCCRGAGRRHTREGKSEIQSIERHVARPASGGFQNTDGALRVTKRHCSRHAACSTARGESGAARRWARTPTTSHPEQRGCRASPRWRRARRACAAPGSATSRKRGSHCFPYGARATRRAEQAPPRRRACGRGLPCTAVAVLHEPFGGRTGARARGRAAGGAAQHAHQLVSAGLWHAAARAAVAAVESEDVTG